jgi:hypothetical protein
MLSRNFTSRMGHLIICVTMCALTAGGGVCAAAEPEPSAEVDLPPAARAAIARGVEFLIRNQNQDGSWNSDGKVGRYPAAMTAMCGLALVAGGSLPSSGPHATSVRRAVEYLLAHADPESGLIGGEESGRPMFGHGYAMLFLAEVYGSEGDPALCARIEKVLRKAVELSARCQSKDGGWYYTPDPKQDEGAVTVTQMQGLRACAEAGIPVPARVMEAGIGYVRKAANPDGGIAYRAVGGGDSRPAITCAAVITLYSAGLYESELARNAFTYAKKYAPQPGEVIGSGHFYYAHLYLSQVMYFQGGRSWTEYFEKVRDWLVQNQNADGSWQGDFFGTAYGTAVALLILELPYNTLPAAQR